jgi:tetratricopeptide (TPR) repeat protein
MRLLSALALLSLTVATPALADPTATAVAFDPDWTPVARDPIGRSAYGLFLAGKIALTRGEAATGARYLTEAHALEPAQETVRAQTFTSVLLAGDLDLAASLAPTDAAAPPALREAGKLVDVVQTFARGDAESAYARLRARPVGAPHDAAAMLVAPWLAAAAGDWGQALAPVPAGADPLMALLARQQRAVLLESRRRHDEAEAELRSMAEAPGAGSLLRLPYGEFLERRGRRREALAIYDAAIAADEADASIAYARERAARGGQPPALPGLRAGAAAGLTAAAGRASAEGAHEFAVVYLRLALNLDPAPGTRLRLGQALQAARLEAPSRAVLEGVGPQDPNAYAAARLQLGLSLERDGRSEAALVVLREAAAAAPDNPVVLRVLATQLVTLDRYDEALALLNGPVLNTADQDPEVRFLRGAVYEELGRVPEAEAELWAALQANPEDPILLNYLGYLWVDSGARVTEGAEMIARAWAAQPDSGNIQDSLGWAQYRQGQYETAVDTLEQAVSKEPANAEINDHLGDAYWRVGRQREAGFQWRRVLTLDPDAGRRAEVERKLAQGLDAATAAD